MKWARDAPSRERGGILVMAAILLIGLFGALALAIDSARISTTTRQKAETADSMALAAINAYASIQNGVSLNLPITSAEQQTRFRAAVERALGVAKANQMTHRFFEAHAVGGSEDLVPGFNDGQADLPGVRGQIESGRYYIKRPERCTRFSGCPCTLPTTEGSRGCFLKCSNAQGCRSPDASELNYYPANAMRVTLWNAPGEGVENLFARLLNVPESVVRGAGAAALIPRRVVVLPSLARSESVESHLPGEKVPSSSTSTSAEYAFVCQNGCQPRAPSTNTPASCDGSAFRPYQFRSTDASRFTRTPGQVWGALPLTNSPPAAHAKMDYECVRFQFGQEGSFVSALVDLRAFAPQPFSTILQATRQTLLSFAGEQRGGVEVALLGFASTLQADSWSLTSQTGGALSGRRWELTTPSMQNPRFQAMLAVTTLDELGRGKRFQNGFFPLGSDPYADLPTALITAQQMLAGDGTSGLSQNTVVYIGSGLTNCWRPSGGGASDCALTYSANVRSLEQSVLEILGGNHSGGFLATQTTFFPILVGANVKPHRLLFRSNSLPHHCMTGGEAVLSRCQTSLPSLTAGGQVDHALSVAAFREIGSSPTPASYFIPGYYLSHGASTTGGRLIPVLGGAGCPQSGSPLCQSTTTPGKTNFSELLDGACQSFVSAPANQLACADPKRSWQWRVIDSRSPGLRPDWQDDTGRVYCDSQCRTVAGQVAGVLEELGRAPPLRLIEASE